MTTIILCFVSLSGYCQEKEILVRAQMPPGNRVFIKSKTILKYAVSYDKINWSETSIGSTGQPDVFIMDKSSFYIKVVTTGKPPVIYSLIANSYYLIDWNTQKGVWDVYAIEKK